MFCSAVLLQVEEKVLKIEEVAMKKFLVFLAIFLLATSTALQAAKSLPPEVTRKADRIHLPGDPINQSGYVEPGPVRDDPRRDDWIGDRALVGDTWYDYQSNGSVGRMIAMDQDAGIHITWMDGYGSDMGASQRHMKYNYLRAGDDWLNMDGEVVDGGLRGGYGCIDLTTDETPRAMVFYHNTLDGIVWSMCGVDWDLGVGAFNNVQVPRYPDSPVLWPQGVMSPEGRIHIAYNRLENGRMLSYAQGALDRGGAPVFGENPTPVADTHLNTYRIASSPNSERVAITWMRSRVDNLDIHDFAQWDGFLAYQMNNDLMLAWTDDGINWNFNEPVNITDNIPPDPRQEGSSSYGDTLRTYATHDIIFDAQDNIHVIFDARLLRVQAIPEGNPPVDGLTNDMSYLFHWSEDAEEITAVADGWFSQLIYDENDEPILKPEPGAWRSNVCNPSMAYAENGDLYCVYNYYPHGDYSIRDRCNGDVAVTVSEDNGATWYYPTMITETFSGPEAADGEHFCESYPTVDEKVDDFIHITYEMDTEPGTSIQDDDMPATLCQWYYHALSVDEVLKDSIWTGPPWHVDLRPYLQDISRAQGVPLINEAVQVSVTAQPNGGRELASVSLEYVLNGDLDNVASVDMAAGEDDMYTGEIPAQAEDGTTVWYRIRVSDNEDVENLKPEGWWYSYVVRPEGGLLIRDVQYRNPEWTASDASPYEGYQVTVSGVVSTTAEFADEYGAYAIQEASEHWSGVIIRGAIDLAVGDLVQVTGFVRESDENDPDMWAFMTYIELEDPEDVVEIGREESPVPLAVDISDLRFETNAEQLEGLLVSVEECQIDTLNVELDFQGIYFPITDAAEDENEGWLTTYGLSRDDQDELEFGTFVQGTFLFNLTGIFVENQTYAIAPRSIDDMEVSVKEPQTHLPIRATLDPAFPNPFNSSTQIGFEIPVADMVNLSVFDLSGRLVSTIMSEEMTAGRYSTSFDAIDLANGVYLLHLETGSTAINQKLVLVK
jgi:hypothetical protein